MAWVTPTDVDPGDAILASLYNQDVVANTSAIYSRFAYQHKTDTQSSSVSANGSVAVSGLTISYAAANAANVIVVQAFVSTSTSGTLERPDGGFITAAGSAITNYRAPSAGNRNLAFGVDTQHTGDTTINTISIVAVHLPASTTSITYGVTLLNTDNSTRTIGVNRSPSDGDTNQYTRAGSALFLWEMAP